MRYLSTPADKESIHTEIHNIFSTEWQKNVRYEKARTYLESLYAERFGNDYDKIKEFRNWLEASEKKAFILAYLNDNDPYKI